ncbi:hypothetical protein BDD12DRAFT_847529 [Trichophaea hybrida]|nr:hypothetical protein BDD12DRAFT_847529 [Trichophaea hybrida]
MLLDDDYSADILLDTKRCTLSRVATVRGHLELAEMLERLEIKERTRRNLSAVPETAISPQTEQYQSPTAYLDHVMLVLGVFLTGVDAIRYLFLCGLGWTLRNRQLLWWIWSTCFCFGMPVVNGFGWAIVGIFFE